MILVNCRRWTLHCSVINSFRTKIKLLAHIRPFHCLGVVCSSIENLKGVSLNFQHETDTFEIVKCDHISGTVNCFFVDCSKVVVFAKQSLRKNMRRIGVVVFFPSQVTNKDTNLRTCIFHKEHGMLKFWLDNFNDLACCSRVNTLQYPYTFTNLEKLY